MAKPIDGLSRGKVLAHKGYICQKNKTCITYSYWRCSSKNGCAPLKTDIFDVNDPPDIINGLDIGDHNHPTEDETINKQVVVNQIKDTVRENLVVPLRRAYDETVTYIRRQEDAPALEDIPVFQNVMFQIRHVSQRKWLTS